MASASHTRGFDTETCAPGNILDGDTDTYWTTDDWQEIATVLALPEARTFNVVELAEHIGVGQRIERFRLSAQTPAGWRMLAE